VGKIITEFQKKQTIFARGEQQRAHRRLHSHVVDGLRHAENGSTEITSENLAACNTSMRIFIYSNTAANNEWSKNITADKQRSTCAAATGRVFSTAG
jgi:hypothetical protein